MATKQGARTIAMKAVAIRRLCMEFPLYGPEVFSG
jgi:hypothetical protein